jgi:hypothetical protein
MCLFGGCRHLSTGAKISVLPLKADIGVDIVFVRSVPDPDIASPLSRTSSARCRNGSEVSAKSA